MRKGKNGMNVRLIGAGIVLVAIAVFLIAGGGEYLTAFTSGEGLRVTGITADRTISNDADIANAKFIVSTIFDGSGGAIWGTTVGEPFKDQSGKVIPTQYDISITAESVDEYANYIIRNQGIKIYKFHWEWVYRWEDSPPNTIYRSKHLLQQICIYQEDVGGKGKFGSKNVDFEGRIKAEAGGEIASATITNYDSSVTLRTGSGKYVGDASWGGSLVTGTGLPVEGNYAVILPSGSSKWTVLRVEDWGEYENQLTQSRALVQYLGDFPFERDADAIVNPLNAKAGWLLSLPNTQILSSGQTQVKVGGDDAIKVNLRDNNVIWSRQYVTFYIKASWVGAWVPVGMPKILSTDCEDIHSGEPSVLHITVMNVGSAPSTFRAALLSGCKFQQIGQSEISIGAGQTKTMDMRVSQGVNNLDQLETCTIKVYDANKGENYDTASVTCQLLKARECFDIGSYKGDTQTNCIAVCNQDGIWQEVHCCGDDEELDFDASKTQYDGWYCKAGNGNGGNGDDDCYVDCVADEDCGLGVTIPGMACRVKCYVGCWFYDKIIYFIGGTVLLVLLLIWKVFSKVSPHARAVNAAIRK